MKQLFFIAGMCLTCLSLSSGCISLAETRDGSLQNKLPYTGRRIGQDLLEAVREKNYTALSGILVRYGGPVPGRKEFLRADREFSSQFGTIVCFRFLTELETPAVRNLLWIVTLERQSAQQKEKKIRQELLFRLVLAENRKTGAVRILGMGFF